MRFILLCCVLLLSPFSQLAAQMQEAQPWLGVAIEENPKGVLIKAVLENTPAQRAGLHEGDLILKIDQSPVHKRDELLAILRGKGVGNSVTVHFQRQGKQLEEKLKLEALPDSLELVRRQLLNKEAPAFDLVSLVDKTPIKSSDFKNQVLILEFWATWCPACRSAIPRLNEWAKAHKNIRVIGVSDEEESVLKAFTQKEVLSYTIARDPTNKIQSKYQTGSIPAFILIDSKGKVVDVALGAGSYLEELLQHAEKLR